MDRWTNIRSCASSSSPPPSPSSTLACALSRLLYADIDAALAFLDHAFGFECERARGAGAQITEEPADQDYGERRFGATDPEGHKWCLSQTIAQVAPQDWGATTPAEASAG